jgi:hypothetical protein
MNDLLLSETLGEDTTTQLYRDAEGGYHVRVMALPGEGGGEKLATSHSPRIYTDQPVGLEEARALYRAAAAKRHVDAAQAFPGAAA